MITELGLDTGFRDSKEGINLISNAGMELDIRDVNSPYIVKSPWICDYIEDAIIPMRDLFLAAESQIFVSAKASNNIPPDQVPGGLWHTHNPENQESILVIQLYNLQFSLVKYDIPIIYLVFTKFIKKPILPLYKALVFP